LVIEKGALSAFFIHLTVNNGGTHGIAPDIDHGAEPV
jgi:hypothetical protein